MAGKRTQLAMSITPILSQSHALHDLSPPICLLASDGAASPPPWGALIFLIPDLCNASTQH